jgi:hypothetical protein
MAAARQSRLSVLLSGAVNGYPPATVQQRHSAMISPKLVALTALFVIRQALAAESVVLRQESAEGIWDFDTASIVVVSETLRKSRMTLKLKRPFQDQSTGNVYDRVVFQYEHDCKEKKMRIVSSLAYFQGEPVKTTGAKDEWQSAQDSAVHQYACSVPAK